MSTKEQLAEQLAVELSVFATWRDDFTGTLARSAAELRRLEAANADLIEALRYIHDLSLTEDYRDLPAIFGRMRAAIAKHGGAA